MKKIIAVLLVPVMAISAYANVVVVDTDTKPRRSYKKLL